VRAGEIDGMNVSSASHDRDTAVRKDDRAIRRDIGCRYLDGRNRMRGCPRREKTPQTCRPDREEG
jgi:hypothetical protein